jgi:hypothetical protein
MDSQISEGFEAFEAVPVHAADLVVMKIQLFQRVQIGKRSFADGSQLIERQVSAERKSDKCLVIENKFYVIN